MSVTIADLMILPSLREAKVMAGEKGMYKTISSITVLESDDPSVIGSEKIINSSDRYGSEIVITSFFDARNDVKQQCKSLKRLYDDGEAAVIIYYIGIVIPSLDKEVIELGNRLDFPIIAMPQNKMELRYSDVICEVMEAIVKDRLNDVFFASEIIEKISHLDQSKRNINSVLDMLRDRIHCSIYILDYQFRILNTVEWPKDRGIPIATILELKGKEHISEELISVLYIDNKKIWTSKELIDIEDGYGLYLMLIKETEGLNIDVCKQVKDVVKTYLNLWASNYGNIETKQLIKSILNDEPEKMRRIAQILHVDIKTFSSMLVFSIDKTYDQNINESDLVKSKEFIQNYLKAYLNKYILGEYEGSIVLIADDSIDDKNSVLTDLLNEMIAEYNCGFIVCTTDKIKTASEAKLAYDSFCKYRMYSYFIYPIKKIITFGEIQFVEQCVSILNTGELEVMRKTDIILTLTNNQRNHDLLETLMIFFLDADFNVGNTSKIMFVHKNTIKYRISCLKKLFGHELNKMPEMQKIYTAVALERLLISKANKQ